MVEPGIRYRARPESDGKADLVVANSYSYASVLVGNGDGTFHFSNRGLGTYPLAMAVGDFNGDGRPDIAGVYGRINDTLSILLSTPGCALDFNHSCSVTVQDISDYLSAWFARLPSADFNHSGADTAQDIFDFLAAFFAGCG